MSKLKPNLNNVIIVQDEESETTYGNIIVADIDSKRPLTGVIIAVGPGTFDSNGKRIPIDVKVGERIAFPSFGGIKLTIEGKEYICLKDQEIITVIEE